jgi:sugar phosphate isomerase/epimerase
MTMQNEISRRSFLGKSVAAGAAAAAVGRVSAKPLGLPIGIQPYTVRNELTQDLKGTIEKLAQMGYESIEIRGSFYGHTTEELQRVLKTFGLASPSGSYEYPQDDGTWAKSIELAKLLNVKYMITTVPKEWIQSLDGWKRAAERFNELGAACKKAGIQLAYHNHNYEFKSFDGRVAYDEFLRLTDPELVAMELDCFWAVFAGKDPIEYFKRYPKRFPLLHVKGLKAGFEPGFTSPKGNPFTEVGSGVIDYKPIFKAAGAAGLKHYFVEQDRWDRPPLESARISCEYLRKLEV